MTGQTVGRWVVAIAIASTVALGGQAVGSPVRAQPDPGPAPVSLTPLTNPLVALPGAGASYLARYRSTSVNGQPVILTASLLLPATPRPRGGWPLAVWNHMTTGNAFACAPTLATRGASALADMTSGDRIVAGLLRAGFAVVRPDYEGLGTAGRHPYLIGPALARSVIDAARAVVSTNQGVSGEVVVAGHSEGSVAALFAAAAPPAQWGSLRLRAVAAVTPPTRLGEMINAVGAIPVRAGRTTGEFVALAALMIDAAAHVDARFGRLIRSGGLSPQALALLPLVDRKCFRDLAGPAAFGRLAPAELLGPRGDAAQSYLAGFADRNDVGHLRICPRIPVRLDAGLRDAVAPLPVVAELGEKYRRRGSRVTLASHPAGHSDVPRLPDAARAIVDWLAAQTYR